MTAEKQTQVELSDIALLVMSCDKYLDVARHYFILFNRHVPWWGFKKFIVLEDEDFNSSDVRTIKTGKNLDWNSRLKYALSQIKERYVLYVQEDYFIGKTVKESDFIDALSYIRENHISYYKLDSFPKIKSYISPESHLSRIPNNVRYGVNLLTAIFEKTYFEHILPAGAADAWMVEASFLNQVSNRFSGYVADALLDTRNLFCTQYAVRQGKWWPDAIKYFEKRGYSIDVSSRGLLSKKVVLKIKIGHFLNHHIPTPFFRFLKKMLIKVGFKFVSEG